MKYQKSNLFFRAFAGCKVVKGANQSLICDLQREQFYKIPNDLAEIISLSGRIKLADLYNMYTEANFQALDGYFDFLEKNQFIFFVDENLNNFFPEISSDWDYPATITNSILEIDGNSNYSVINVLKQLEGLGCAYLQLRFKEVVTLKDLSMILAEFYDSKFCYEILIPYSDFYKDSQILLEFIENNLRVNQIVVYNSPQADIVASKRLESTCINYVIENLSDHKFCGSFAESSMFSNLQFYTEGVSFNTCLNRKISIDENGNIKNCPSLQGTYGNINEISLAEVLQQGEIKKNWFITKDLVSVCKDCEYRRICMDCRAYLEDPEDIFSKPLKCGYNPYTCEWEEWSTNPLKQKAIDYYGMRSIIDTETSK